MLKLIQNLIDEIVAENINDLFQIYFVLLDIFMDNKYIFVPYEGRFDAIIFLQGIFLMQIYCVLKEKKRKVSSAHDICSKFMSYISL